MQDGVMIAGIIDQYKNSPAGVGAYLAQLFHEDPKRVSVKSAQLPLKDKLPIGKSYGTEVTVSASNILAFSINQLYHSRL